jgi:hypothetical protein
MLNHLIDFIRNWIICFGVITFFMWSIRFFLLFKLFVKKVQGKYLETYIEEEKKELSKMDVTVFNPKFDSKIVRRYSDELFFSPHKRWARR